MPDLAVVLAAVALPFAATAAVPLVWRLLGERTGYYGAAVALACFGLLATQVGETGRVGVDWIPSLSVELSFYVDAWALLFALLASGIGVLIFAYSTSYMHGADGLSRYYAALLAFMGSILGVALASDLVALFLFWELTSVASFVLIGFHADDAESQYASRMAMLITVGGGLFLLVAVLFLSVAAEAVGLPAFDLAAMLAEPDAVAGELRARGLFVPALAALVIAAGAKSAQVPLHVWLPNAMVAPTPVSAFLHSATMVKVGVYFLGRVRPLLASPEWSAVVATLGILTMTVGAALAVASLDVKQLLAYSTASHLGYMVAGFGLLSYYGAAAGSLHLLHHAAFKAALFLVAGIVAHEAGTRRLDELGGLRGDLPVTAAVAGVTGLAMAGVPPFSGFYSKELLFEALVEAGAEHGGLWWLLPALATVASVFTVVYSLRFLWLFLGEKPAELGDVHGPPTLLVVPPLVLAGLTAVLSLAPIVVDPLHAAGGFLGAAATATGGDPSAVHVGLPTELSPALGMSAGAIVVGVAAFPAAERIGGTIRVSGGRVPPTRPSWWYDRGLAALGEGSDVVVPAVQNGLVRTYATWVVAATVALAALGYAAVGPSLPAAELVGVSPAVVVVLLVAVVAALGAARTPAHVVGVLLLSLLGLMLAIVFILASAPDLALTQLVVETLTLLLFLLVIEELPAYYGEVDRWRGARDAVLSVAVGATAFVTTVLTAERADSALAGEFLDRAVDEGGGANVVNVVLTDFRAFDTLGESVVIVLAAVSVLTLVTMRDRGESP